MRKKLIAIIIAAVFYEASAQNQDRAFLRLAFPVKENNAARSAKQFISGATCKTCALTLNGSAVKVYPTGGFASEVNLKPGENVFSLVASGAGNTQARKRLIFNYFIPKIDTVRSLDIALIETFPEGNLLLSPGELIQFRVKAMPGAIVTVNGSIPLYELPTDSQNTMPGIYQGEMRISEKDSLTGARIPVTIRDASGKTVTKFTGNTFTVMNPASPEMVRTKGRLAHLLFGLGDDRLGGTKMSYLDSMIPLRVVGKVGSLYKIRLSKFRTAYIPDEWVDVLPKGYLTPGSLTGNWQVYGDSLFDFVKVGLFSKLPYQTFQLLSPSRIVVDIFGATNNTNWITQMETAREIRHVYYEQIEDEVLRVTIELKHPQHWGHVVYYEGNRLVVRVRRQPASLELRNLRIAIDPGHGGGNTGASGPTGSSEKELALAVSLKLRQALRLQGAYVMMTRTSEKFVDNKERILMYRDSLPDLLVSIHLNSSSDPVNVGGASTYYKHAGFRNLSLTIYKRMLELGLKEWGNTGSFNFMLNGPIEYPNALVEMLFLSNPEEEMLILDDGFQQKMAEKILQGIRDFLESCKE